MSKEMITAFSFSEKKLTLNITSYRTSSDPSDKIRISEQYSCEEGLLIGLGNYVKLFAGGFVTCKNANQYKLFYAFTKATSHFISIFHEKFEISNLVSLYNFLDTCSRTYLIRIAQIFIDYFSKSYPQVKYAVIGRMSVIDNDGEKREYIKYLTDKKSKRYQYKPVYYDFLKAQYLYHQIENGVFMTQSGYEYTLIKENEKDETK